MIHHRILISSFLLLALSGCDLLNKNEPKEVEVAQDEPLAQIPNFNANNAYSYIEKQLSFGSRVPNTSGHKACSAYLINYFKGLADTVYVQNYTVTAFDGTKLQATNIIASFNPAAAKRIMYSAHWDSRPFADQDAVDRDKPIPAANDAGSGVAVLMEMANAIKSQPVAIGVDLILFDAEDYGQPADSKLPQVNDSYCLGSQYWAKTPHVPDYKAMFGINLDMVGASDAVFMKETFSVTYADWLSQYVWNIAAQMGYSSLFVPQLVGAITDDHLYVIRGRKIPMIDVIHYTNESGFGVHWHTHRDDMSWISKNTLEAVGRVMLQVLYEYDKKEKAV
jgi:glutaminyl-peptide cyclotransferase